MSERRTVGACETTTGPGTARGAAARRWSVSLCLLSLLFACKQSEPERPTASVQARAASSAGGERAADDQGRCSGEGVGREVSEYDTSGDEYADVRKVFLVIGEGRLARLVLICREADLNGDGVKDVVRYYDDEGRPQREESDRNFDGRMDQVTLFEEGRILRVETDSVGDGRIDTKVFYEEGRPSRAERDLAARSTATEWRPDRWEYFEDGQMIRMGTDLDGDGRVDRWDRNADWMRAQQEAERQREREAQEAAERAAGGDDGDDDAA
ncbi:MAG: hypothetical protein AAF447_06440 [Myxococcota bacterium]